MVHALEMAWRSLRADGVLVDIRPDVDFNFRIGIVTGGRRVTAGRLVNPAFRPPLVASQTAIQQVLQRRLFALGAVRRHSYRVRLDRLSQVADYIAANSDPKPRLGRGTRARLRELWRRRDPNTRIEITDGFVISVLWRRSV